MADVYQKIKLLDLFRLNPDKFLPLVDHAWKVFPAKDRGKQSLFIFSNLSSVCDAFRTGGFPMRKAFSHNDISTSFADNYSI